MESLKSQSSREPHFRINLVSLHGPPWPMDVEPGQLVVALKQQVAKHLSRLGKNISPCYIRLRAKSAKAVPGVELEDGEPISSYGVCRGGAIFLLIDPPMPEPKEPAAPGPRAEPESAANRTGEDSVRQCGGAVPDEAPPRGGAQPALPGDSASRQDAGASPGTPSSIDDDWLQSPRKKKRTKAWTEGHILKLVRGVEKHGLGAWAAILRDRELQFPMGATQVTLKDKWRNLVIAVQKGKKMRGVSLSPVVLQKIRDIAEGAG
uniref:Myb-like domain-containing protein n=1 Tax=Tetraselmis sp. GSL018 TaxID=582737 RepID=A0A061SIE8_9CHLO|eukprot:CAMPEP_0177614892 /NCGR_PEP_ID=MMETSP0419_2-20121207/23047_1 /TAXON_ID=582737 /ORGANISM="Tetraselmis sp., Strain GSL018" /LENGTH=262 /DNA_ID=CAMNT_0019112279 /DNA_START=365 /DNA_END=1153 /DNA_ORIENTATION=-